MIIAIIAFILGIIPGFLIVFNSVFSDSNGSISERLFTFVLVILAYVLLGFIVGVSGKGKPRLLGMIISAPAVIILVLYSFKETTLIGLNILYLSVTIISSLVGTFLGNRVAINREKL